MILKIQKKNIQKFKKMYKSLKIFEIIQKYSETVEKSYISAWIQTQDLSVLSNLSLIFRIKWIFAYISKTTKQITTKI